VASPFFLVKSNKKKCAFWISVNIYIHSFPPLFWGEDLNLRIKLLGLLGRQASSNWEMLPVPVLHLFFLMILGLEFRASCLVGRHFYCLSHSTNPVPYLLRSFYIMRRA
jgi:hypothetical protein